MSESESKKKTSPPDTGAPTDAAPERPASPTAGRRRAMYGTNVVIAVAAAIAVAVLFNWLVDWQYDRVPPAVKRWVRYDLTATRRYTLSPQTRKLLSNLDQPRRIVTLFRPGSEQLQRIDDLVDEYGRYSNQLTIQHLDPTRDITGRESFYQDVRDRYADANQASAAAVKLGQKTLTATAEDLEKAQDPLTQALQNNQFSQGQSRQFVSSVVSIMQRQRQDMKTLRDQVAVALDSGLPSYATLQGNITQTLTALRSGLLDQAIRQFNQLVKTGSPPDAVQELMLQSVQAMQEVRQGLDDPVHQLESATPSKQYEQARGVLLNNESIAVLSPDGARVIPIQQMYREADPQAVQQAGAEAIDDQFIGEEKLTGALVSLGLKVPPMVVFVNTRGNQALGSRGSYTNLADRLEANDFKVTQWSPEPKQTSYGQQMPAQAPPQAQPGQKTIWVIPPIAPPNQQNPMAAAQDPAAKVAPLLKSHMDKGDAALVMLNVDPGMRFGAANPLVDYLHTWQIRPQLDELIVREQKAPNQPEPSTTTRFLVDQWPSTLPITKALARRQGLFAQASPILTGPAESQDQADDDADADADDNTKPAADVTTYPLVRLTGNRMWTTSDFSSPKAMQNAKFDDATAADRFTIGVAAQRPGPAEGAPPRRMIVIADPVWALDQVTTYGQSLLGSGPGAGIGPGGVLAFPANGELFVNSVYWLAGLDQLIAASPRTQDIRRISAVSNDAYYGYFTLLVAGMPAAALLAGVGVYFIRRRA